MKPVRAIKVPIPSLGEGHACYVFDCPGPGHDHMNYVVAKEGGPSSSGYRDIPEFPGLHVLAIWCAKTVGDLVTITPSLDASKSCGWHGPYEWQVKVMGTADLVWKAFQMLENLPPLES